MKNVLLFNMRRNKMELDEKLELDMLHEEIKEFYEAETLAEQIDAMIDVRYVYEGTQLKYNYNLKPMPPEITKIVGEFHRYSSTIVSQILGDDSTHLDKIMSRAWDIVCDINELKVSELDENGKVVKQHDLPNATHKIAELLESVLTDSEI